MITITTEQLKLLRKQSTDLLVALKDPIARRNAARTGSDPLTLHLTSELVNTLIDIEDKHLDSHVKDLTDGELMPKPDSGGMIALDAKDYKHGAHYVYDATSQTFDPAIAIAGNHIGVREEQG